MLKRILIGILLLCSARLGFSAYHSYAEMHIWGKSIVRLLGAGGGGTGFEVMYHGKQYTVTNDHVCELGGKDGRLIADSPYTAIQGIGILYRSPITDVCILEPVKELPALKFGIKEFEPFDTITILGHPKLKPLYASHGVVKWMVMEDVLMYIIQTPDDEKECHLPKNRIVSIFFGLFKACTIHVRAQRTTALIEPGNSGSPVLDWWGRVRGIAFAAGPNKKGSIIPLNDMLKAFRLHLHPLKHPKLNRCHRNACK